MWPYPWTHVGTPSHLGHMDRVAATMPSQAHAGAAQEAPDIGQWEGQDVPLVRPSSCNVKGGIPSSRRYLPTYLPATYQEGDWVLVHHSRLPAWPRSTSDDPYLRPYKTLSVDGHRITVRCSPRLGGTLVCAAQHLKRSFDPEDLCGEEWELNDEEIAALDLQGAASHMEVAGEVPDTNAEEMAKEGFYLVKSVLRHRYRRWHFLTLREGFGVEEATWEPFSAFVLPEGRLNSVLVDYLSKNNLGELLRLAETLASKTKARD